MITHHGVEHDLHNNVSRFICTIIWMSFRKIDVNAGYNRIAVHGIWLCVSNLARTLNSSIRMTGKLVIQGIVLIVGIYPILTFIRKECKMQSWYYCIVLDAQFPAVLLW